MNSHFPKSKALFLAVNSRRASASASVAAALLMLLGAVPAGQTQYPIAPMPLVGSTPGANLRNAAAATLTQSGTVQDLAGTWQRRASSPSYRLADFQQDYANMQFQFQALRQQFNWAGSLALQLGRARANNAVAELDAGLNIIAELFTFLEGQYNAGTLDRQTIVRTCRSFADAMGEWNREFRKNSSRLGLVW